MFPHSEEPITAAEITLTKTDVDNGVRHLVRSKVHAVVGILVSIHRLR